MVDVYNQEVNKNNFIMVVDKEQKMFLKQQTKKQIKKHNKQIKKEQKKSFLKDIIEILLIFVLAIFVVLGTYVTIRTFGKFALNTVSELNFTINGYEKIVTIAWIIFYAGIISISKK